MPQHASIFITTLLLAASSGCGGSAPTTTDTPPPADVATTPAEVVADDPGLDTPAVRRLPRDVDHVMRVHLAAVRGTPFEELVRERFPLGYPGEERDLRIAILSRADTVTIGLSEEAIGWVLEGELGPSFDEAVQLFSERGAPTIRGEAGERSAGDERIVIAEAESTVTLHMPAAAAESAGEIPLAVLSPELRELLAALPDVPADRKVVFEAWLAPSWGLFRDLKLVARLSYGAASNDLHIDAALLYPDAELAAARASGWGDFWEAFAEESPESFDRDSARVRSDGAKVVLHHELRELFGEPDANERAIMWTLVSLAVHQPRMDFR